MSDTTLIQRLDEILEDEELHHRYAEPIGIARRALEQQAAQIAALRADADRLRASAEKVILWNRDHANDQYGDPDKAEAWVCVRELRAALRQEQPT